METWEFDLLLVFVSIHTLVIVGLVLWTLGKVEKILKRLPPRDDQGGKDGEEKG